MTARKYDAQLTDMNPGWNGQVTISMLSHLLYMFTHRLYPEEIPK